MFISLIMPTYHSEDFIEDTISEIERYVSSSENSFEIVVVDDGSLDGTFDKLSEISGKTKLNLRIIQLYTNRGQFQALMAGFANAGGEYVVTLDDDLEYHPGQIDLLIDTFVKEPGRYDVVIGVPEDVKKSLLRSAGSFVKNEVNTIMFDKPRSIRSGCFRMMTAELAGKLLEFRTANPIIGPLIFKATRRVANVTVEHRKGLRKSNYSLGKLINTFYNNLQNFSEFPLRYISISGMALSFISILMTAYYLTRYFTGFPRPITELGWTSLIVAITFFSGAILFSLGFIGQYIFKIIEEVNKAPNYQIRNIIEYNKEGTRHKGKEKGQRDRGIEGQRIRIKDEVKKAGEEKSLNR